MSRSAFAPAHVSGLFSAHADHPDPMHRGSRGAGWCLEKGAYATVDHGDGSSRIRVQGREDPAPVTRQALERLAPGASLDVEVCLELPVGQGFGMSAAGTLAVCLATCNLLELDPEAALQATHEAEVRHATGLGDAVGSWFGAGDLRVKPGCPPHGWAMRVEPPEGARFLFCVLGDPIDTASVVGDPAWRERTQEHGDAAVDRILDAGRPRAWSRMLVESAVFSHKLGLMPARMAALGARLEHGIQWGQCMVGSTLWVTGAAGDLERAEALLEGHGRTFHARVDPNGARMVRSVPSVHA